MYVVSAIEVLYDINLKHVIKYRNVVRNYYQTGYIWEQYDQDKGTGKGTRLFTGWSALTLLIMSEEYPIF